MKMVLPVLAAAFALTAGCATQTPGPMYALTPEAGFQVQYSGGVGPVDQPELPKVDSAVKSEKQVLFTLRLLRLPADAARSLLGEAGVIGAGSLTTAQVDELLAKSKSMGMETLSTPRIVSRDGQQARVEIGAVVSFVSGFVLSGKEKSRLADPVIETLTNGITLDVCPVVQQDGDVEVTLALRMAEVQKPIHTTTVKVFGSDMTVQTPVVTSQTVTGSGRVAKDRVLLISGMVGKEQEVYLLLVQAQAFTPATSKDTGDQPDIIIPAKEK